MADVRPDAADTLADDGVGRAVAAFAHALRLSCRAAQHPDARALANEAVAAHLAARAWAERAVRNAAAGGPAAGRQRGDGPPPSV